jgi:hypothetical protein
MPKTEYEHESPIAAGLASRKTSDSSDTKLD